jgi:hypothetical protein
MFGKALVLLLLLTLQLRATPLVAQSCPCDCDADLAVRVHELTLGVNIALERRPLFDCFAADVDGDERVEIAELISGVDAGLNGCAAIEARRTLAAARARFEHLAAHNYDYNYQRSCFCFDPHNVDIEVRDDEIVSIREKASGREVVPQDPNAYLTIPQLFDFIDDALGYADVIEVEYEETTGVPRSLEIDFFVPAVDDELAIRIADFRVVVEGACRSDADCDGPASRCIEPGGFVGCGICQHLEDPCTFDADCPGDLICELSPPSACSCQGPVLVCQQGCGGDGDCAEGENCAADRHCRAKPCSSAPDCPAQFRCSEGAGVCQRLPCSEEDDCAGSGRCVNAFCYDDFGSCEAIPP